MGLYYRLFVHMVTNVRPFAFVVWDQMIPIGERYSYIVWRVLELLRFDSFIDVKPDLQCQPEIDWSFYGNQVAHVCMLCELYRVSHSQLKYLVVSYFLCLPRCFCDGSLHQGHVKYL